MTTTASFLIGLGLLLLVSGAMVMLAAAGARRNEQDELRRHFERED